MERFPGRELFVSVNLSARQFRDSDVVADVVLDKVAAVDVGADLGVNLVPGTADLLVEIAAHWPEVLRMYRGTGHLPAVDNRPTTATQVGTTPHAVPSGGGAAG